MKCAGHVARGERRGAYRVSADKSEGKRPLERPSVDVRIILKRIKMWDGRMGWIDLAQDKREVVGACECGSELSGSIKCGEILD